MRAKAIGRSKAPRGKGPGPGRASSAYLDLLRSHPPRPIASKAELARVQAVVDRLAHRGNLTNDEEDFLCLLGMLIERWEDEHGPEIPPATDAELLRHLMEDRSLTQTALATASGVVNTTISAILAGRRRINRQHAQAFGRALGIDPGLFLSNPA